MTDEFDSNGQELDRKPDLKTEKVSDSFSSGYKECRWCGDLVNKETCFARHTGVSLICEICGKDVTGWDK